jgi:hypothetical protein
MKYVVIVSLVVVALLGLVEWMVPPSQPLTDLQREEDARMAGELTRPDLPPNDSLQRATQRVPQGAPPQEPTPAVEEVPSPLETFLTDNPSSPIGLLSPEEAEKYVPTRENLIAWVSTVEEFKSVDPDAIEYDEELSYLWKICKEHQALRAFSVAYQDRERERWANGLNSVALEDELQPALSFIGAQCGNDADVWSALNAYSTEVIHQIYGEGELAEKRTDVESRWDLVRAFSAAGSPSFDAVAAILLE